MTNTPLTWTALADLDQYEIDRVHGPTNAQARLRLFGRSPQEVRVTLYRDHHAWCPYCQKVWFWLEEKQIPYRIEKVTMFCYGQKESWYRQKVPSGMLPALALDGRLITESDDILMALERAFGPLNHAMEDDRVLPLRRLERLLFRAWCTWLCCPARSAKEEERRRAKFIEVAQTVEAALASTSGPYFLDQFGLVDVIFTPYVERMNASLYYYKGYSLRHEHPLLANWFDGLEARPTYRGTQGDFHTHAHDLPPQMGGCWANEEPQTQACQAQVDSGPWWGLPDVAYEPPDTAKAEALGRVLKHRDTLIRVNPAPAELFEEGLRCALTRLMTGELCQPPQGSEVGLRYLRDRISVPRDMTIYAAKHLRQALEDTAALVGPAQGEPLPVQHRRDQDPANFVVGLGV